MTVTRVRDLVVVAVLVGVLGFFAARGWYDRLPPLSWPPAAALLVVVVVEFTMAARLRAVIGHDPDARPLPAVVVARWTAVGSASAVVGAVVTGLAAGFVGAAAERVGEIVAARGDLVWGAVLLLAAATVAVAGCVLERSGVAPRPPSAGAGRG